MVLKKNFKALNNTCEIDDIPFNMQFATKKMEEKIFGDNHPIDLTHSSQEDVCNSVYNDPENMFNDEFFSNENNLKEFLRHCDVNTKFTNGKTILLYAATVYKPVYPPMKDPNKILMEADPLDPFFIRLERINFLLSKGADYNLQDLDNKKFTKIIKQ